MLVCQGKVFLHGSVVQVFKPLSKLHVSSDKKAERKEHSENTSDLNWGGRRVVSPPQDETKPPVWERKSLATSQGQIIRFFCQLLFGEVHVR